MNTPIVDFVENYIKSNTSRLHMPGHKGVSFLGCEKCDITEIAGADDLFSPEGIILESENNASLLFGTSKTVYSAGGSTQSIHAMVYLAYAKANKITKPFILAGRNAHKSLIYALAKLDADVKWLYSDSCDSICNCSVSPRSLENELKSLPQKPFAVYITSPDYMGVISDIYGLSKVCRKYDIPLLVDNAHGSYLKFCKEDLHPISLGADMCCDSAHKTLPVLTGGGYLHIAESDRYGFSKNAVKAMEFFGSTSPSYLILQSLDLCNKYIDGRIRYDIEKCAEKVRQVNEIMKKCGVRNISDEPLKITADFRKFDFDFKKHFRNNGIEFEYADNNFAVFMFSPQNSDTDFERIKNAVFNIPKSSKEVPESPEFPVINNIISVRNAVFSDCETVNVKDSQGRICASPTVSCPPAVPIAISGEIITQQHIKLFEYYGIEKISVVK